MILESNDDDSDSRDSDQTYPNQQYSTGDDVEVYLNHYRIPKLINSGSNSSQSQHRSRSNKEQVKYNNDGKIMSLTELAAQKVACHLPFGQVEHFDPPVPEPMQCRIAFWSFPQDEEDVRLYTCLANGNADVFIRAEDLISLNCVCDMLQVGFHLSANVKFIQDSSADSDCFRVAITFDRRRITSCSCSCTAATFWCQHAVAVCLQRIRRPQEVTLRAPVSESLQRLEKNQLQKFAQYLINELPQQILPAAQKLLDELLSGEDAHINKNPAAPDPTAGATINEQTNWCLDDTHLSMDIQKILLKQCTAQPTVCSDIQALHFSAPPAATEYSQLLRPIRGRDPEGLWNLISIVGEMMKRRDSNFFLLLEIMTEEVLRCHKIVTWWFEIKVSLHSGSTIHYSCTKNNSQSTSQYSCSNYCDEIVHLWRLAAMNPSSTPAERKRLYKKFFDWHLEILKRHSNLPEGSVPNNIKSSKRNILELFPGFKPSMEGCLIEWPDWDDKKGRIVDLTAVVDEVEKIKPPKLSKRRKKKSRPTKQSGTDNKDLVESNNQENSEYSKIDETLECQPSSSSKIDSSCADENNDTQKVSNEDTSKSTQSNSSETLENRRPLGELNREAASVEVEQEEPAARGDEIEPDLQVYFMDKNAESIAKPSKPESLEDYIKVTIRRLNDPLETLYSKAEVLYAHGHTDEARNLALRAANQILECVNYPSLKQLYTLHRRKKKKGSLDNQMSIVTSEALTKIAFLCNVLIDDPENHNLVFRLALFGVEMKRSPAATKPLEVKLINQKHDLIMLLKTIPLHEEELTILREKAQILRDEVDGNNSNALTTLMLGNYIFEALALSKSPSCSNCISRPAIENSRGGSSSSYGQSGQYQLEEHYLPQQETNQPQNGHICQPCSLIVYGRQPSDASLGFFAALNALSVKVNLLEADHPLLCEGTRRQRGELALSLLTHYKDDQEKLDLVLKHLLDKDVFVQTQSQPESGSSERPSKKNNPSQDPNQPTEASAHFMFELAKTVFDKAGGNSLTAHLFRPQLITQNGGRGIHRKLHMCTLRIALHALGLENRISSSWVTRTYNGRASFIHEQALEIGLPAIKFLCENWEGYLTPVEVASTADKAGCSNDPETKRVAAEMAKSCLKYSNHLDFNAVSRILKQCGEQSIEMIEEACREIEQVAENGNVCAEVLFVTARAWYSLYDDLVLKESMEENGCCPAKENQTSNDQGVEVSGWLVNSNQQHQDKYQQFTEPVHQPIQVDAYGRVDFVPTVYTPTYKHIEYVKAAYRVGIKAVDSLKPSQHMSSKHDLKREDDVLWLLGLSKSLGRECLHKFTKSAIKNITSPHVMHIICNDLIKFFESLPFGHADRVNILQPLIYNCLDRFVKQLRDLMKHFSVPQCPIVDSIIDAAQNLTMTAYTSTAFGQFRDLLKIVDARKAKKNFRVNIETHHRHAWLNAIMQEFKGSTCPICFTCPQAGIKYLS